MRRITNQAQLSYKGITTNSNVAKGELIEEISASKKVLVNGYRVQDEKTYIISLVNVGTGGYTGLKIVDDMGAYQYQPDEVTTLTLYPLEYITGSIQYYQNGDLKIAPTVNVVDGKIEITGVEVPGNGDAVIVYKAKVNEFAPQNVGSTVVNEGVITGGGLSAPITITETINIIDEPYLTITKGISPIRITENGQISYTFDIKNEGNTEAVEDDNVQIKDTFDPKLTGIQVYYNGTLLENTNYEYDADTGVFSTNPRVITVEEAVFAQDLETGRWDIIPGECTIEVVGTI